MSSPAEIDSPEKQEAAKPTRVQNVMRTTKYGLVAGALVGLLTGGGLSGALQFAVGLGGAAAVGGLVAGDKINPLLDKLTSLIPFLKKKHADKGEEVAAQQQQQQHGRGHGIVQSVASTILPSIVPGVNPLSAIDPSQLQAARSNATQARTDAARDMDPDAAPVIPGQITEFVSSLAKDKRPNSVGTTTRQ